MATIKQTKTSRTDTFKVIVIETLRVCMKWISIFIHLQYCQGPI